MRITVDLAGFSRAQRDLAAQLSERRVAAFAATALTRTAHEVAQHVRQEMRRVFDRPTPYTLRSVRVEAATAARPVASVFISERKAPRDPSPAVVLKPQVEGGARGTKGLELALRRMGVLPAGWLVVPGQGARLDPFGNVSRGLVQQVVTQIAQQQQARPKNARAITKAVRRTGGRFIAIPPGARTQPGIYIADVIGRNVMPVFIFVRRATYRQRLDFHGIASRVALGRLPHHVKRAVAESLQRLAGGEGRS